MVSKFQWKPFWLATQRDPQNDWTATQNRVNYDVFTQAPLEITKINLTEMTVRIMAWYSQCYGNHFGLPPSSTHTCTDLE